ncbi:hypothetical protein RB195_019594 [Necator americanus]|uniref:Protein sleepless n=1 Tax=Necator americanus TaxID=51031 RepID=A0ABR1CFR6_NECAM
MAIRIILLFAAFEYVGTLRCYQCNGWQGDYPLKNTEASTCNNLNNQCKSDLYCVKISDPMSPGVPYTTYKSDCWARNNLQVTPTNSVTVQSGSCYDYEDATVPSRRWKYCFCNNEDYCNAVPEWHLSIMVTLPLLFSILL